MHQNLRAWAPHPGCLSWILGWICLQWPFCDPRNAINCTSLSFRETDKSCNSGSVLYTQAFKPKSNITVLGANQVSGSGYLKQVQTPIKTNRKKQIGSNQTYGLEKTRFLASSQNTTVQHSSSETVVTSWIIMLINVSNLLETWVGIFQAKGGARAALHKSLGTGEAGGVWQEVTVNQEPWGSLFSGHWGPGKGRARGCKC